MIIKITDGDVSHFFQFDGDLQVHKVPSMRPEDWGDLDLSDEPAGWHRLISPTEDDEPDLSRPGVVLRPEGLPLKTYLTDWDVYLLSDKGKTVEVLNRME